MAQPFRPIREGVIAGIIGASSVAVWFLIVDTIAGRPLFTPAILGHGVLSIFGPSANERVATYVVFYTIFHYVVFILLGIVLSLFVNRAEQESSVLVALLILFVAFELGFYGFAALLAESRLRELAWSNIAIGNLIATVLMGAYMWRRHPALRREFAQALDGREHVVGEQE